MYQKQKDMITQNFNLTISEIDRVTGSNKWTSTVNDMNIAGWEINDEDIYALLEGATIKLVSPNGRRYLSVKKS